MLQIIVSLYLEPNFFKKQPIYSLPLIWNAFNDMKLQPNKITFQKYVKDYLLSEPAEEQA